MSLKLEEPCVDQVALLVEDGKEIEEKAQVLLRPPPVGWTTELAEHTIL